MMELLRRRDSGTQRRVGARDDAFMYTDDVCAGDWVEISQMDNPSHKFSGNVSFHNTELGYLIVDIDFVSEGLGVKKGKSKKKIQLRESESFCWEYSDDAHWELVTARCRPAQARGCRRVGPVDAQPTADDEVTRISDRALDGPVVEPRGSTHARGAHRGPVTVRSSTADARFWQIQFDVDYRRPVRELVGRAFLLLAMVTDDDIIQWPASDRRMFIECLQVYVDGDLVDGDLLTDTDISCAQLGMDSGSILGICQDFDGPGICDWIRGWGRVTLYDERMRHVWKDGDESASQLLWWGRRVMEEFGDVDGNRCRDLMTINSYHRKLRTEELDEDAWEIFKQDRTCPLWTPLSPANVARAGRYCRGALELSLSKQLAHWEDQYIEDLSPAALRQLKSRRRLRLKHFCLVSHWLDVRNTNHDFNEESWETVSEDSDEETEPVSEDDYGDVHTRRHFTSGTGGPTQQHHLQQRQHRKVDALLFSDWQPEGDNAYIREDPGVIRETTTDGGARRFEMGAIDGRRTNERTFEQSNELNKHTARFRLLRQTMADQSVEWFDEDAGLMQSFVSFDDSDYGEHGDDDDNIDALPGKLNSDTKTNADADASSKEQLISLVDGKWVEGGDRSGVCIIYDGLGGRGGGLDWLKMKKRLLAAGNANDDGESQNDFEESGGAASKHSGLSASERLAAAERHSQSRGPLVSSAQEVQPSARQPATRWHQAEARAKETRLAWAKITAASSREAADGGLLYKEQQVSKLDEYGIRAESDVEVFTSAQQRYELASETGTRDSTEEAQHITEKEKEWERSREQRMVSAVWVFVYDEIKDVAKQSLRDSAACARRALEKRGRNDALASVIMGTVHECAIVVAEESLSEWNVRSLTVTTALKVVMQWITQERRGYYDKGRGNCGTADSQADHADVAVSAVSTRESKSRHARTQGRCGGCSGQGERTHGNSHGRFRVYANERLCVGSSMGFRDSIWRGTRGFYYHSRLANAARALRERG